MAADKGVHLSVVALVVYYRRLRAVGNETTYPDAAVTAGSTRYYTVCAVNFLGEGLQSAELQYTVSISEDIPLADRGAVLVVRPCCLVISSTIGLMLVLASCPSVTD